MFTPVIELDCHGLNTEQAVRLVRSAVDKAGPDTYTVRVIHGFNRGTRIRTAIRESFGDGNAPKVKRIRPGDNQGITELILKEMY